MTLDRFCTCETHVGQQIIRRASHAVIAKELNKAGHTKTKNQCQDAHRDNHLYERESLRKVLHGVNYTVVMDLDDFRLTSGQIRAMNGAWI